MRTVKVRILPPQPNSLLRIMLLVSVVFIPIVSLSGFCGSICPLLFHLT
jgi:hypothetical protein